ncbi:RNA pyrophosphohydrolase [Amphiplicatus metriothermophilus]|uniref:RNA pyrophosphohydrolase n=1 Tax=Amphiplicatus metriothermophilus TaxID=1519374 RepID=A0A239PKB6_9PROT|nr:RNA pyrophosphohydrolase [Amphiplicatus metriothermophilus]MBB5517897.1 putative (di)nucleoside polyphosphate hydrolase [Amphiplicatus metriothermophilus]SNT67769.1 putative (di)nucleoside polyphosphate hydrolase [Amphiplicatus metriothermophilus]
MSIEDHLSHYRPNVGVALFNRDGRVWIGRRVADFADLGEERERWRWQMPQGGIDPGERIEEAAFRELKEETGVVSVRLLALTPGWLAYDFPPGYKKKDWRGQRQKWAAMLFEGEESEIDLAADDKQEFDAWRWAELEETPGLIVPFKRKVYEELARGFAPLRDFIRMRA